MNFMDKYKRVIMDNLGIIQILIVKYVEEYAKRFANDMIENLVNTTEFTSAPISKSYLLKALNLTKLPKHD